MEAIILGHTKSHLGLDGVGGSNPLQMRSGEDFGAGETRFNWLGAVNSGSISIKPPLL
jgi:hypothetical protein